MDRVKCICRRDDPPDLIRIGDSASDVLPLYFCDMCGRLAIVATIKDRSLHPLITFFLPEISWIYTRSE